MRTIATNGDRVRHLRGARGLSQEQLAAIVGYSIKTIYKAENGRKLRRQTIQDLADALRVRAIEIVDDTNEWVPKLKSWHQ